MRTSCLKLLLAGLLGVAFGSEALAQATCQSGRLKVVGGIGARLADWPGQAVLRLRSENGQVMRYFCGGTAISENWVLTAAHCLTDFTDSLEAEIEDSNRRLHNAKLEVVLGAGDLRQVAADNSYPVDQVIIHESYLAAVQEARRKPTQEEIDEAIALIALEIGNDIGLVRLARPWRGAVSTLSLGGASDPGIGAQVRVAGFGQTEQNKGRRRLDRFVPADGRGELFAGSPRLLETAVETIAMPVCQSRYRGAAIAEGQLCAGLEQGGKDSCQGDSGGPLIARDSNGCPYQVGVVSWGQGCALERAYGVYTRVSHFKPWIEQHVGKARGVDAAKAADSSKLSQPELDESLVHLKSLLGRAGGRVQIGIKGGNRLRLGAEVVIEASSSVAGRLVIIDINADREVRLIFPNQFVKQADIALIAANQKVTVPGKDYGFDAFQAQEPVGKNRLLALVVPPEFDLKRFAAEEKVVDKALEPLTSPPSYLMRVIRQIETALQETGKPVADLKRWAYTVTEYHISQ